MGDFRRLQVWRKAHALALNMDRVAAGIRGARYASLRSQLTRAAMSIAANVVEGAGQRSDREFARFLRYAANSCSELQYHLIVARDLRLVDDGDFRAREAELVEVRRMLHGLLRCLGTSETATPALVEGAEPGLAPNRP